MDSERPHRTTTSTSNELFICFTSRLSSSSMKNILSPAHAARDPPPTTSLSRRLRTNGSLKGGQASPMFPSVPKKRGGGGAFENPEPTSPKVTCIGQVRVKSKKKTKQTRSLSKRSNGEASFRKIERTKSQNNDGILHQSHQVFNHQMNNQNSDDSLHNRNNQRWVHFPVTICEALRTFGAEFNCLFPCRSPCFLNNNQRDNNEEKSMELSEESSSRTCGDVFSRWLVALQDGGGKGREIELVVGGGDEVEEVEERAIRRSSRRHVLEDFEIKNEIKIEDKYQDLVEEDPSFSISIPPKNALLLMRCRSDPARVTALANKFWESPLCEDDEEDDEENKYDGKEQAHVVECKVKDYVKLEEKESVYEIEEQEEETETELGKKTNTFSVEVEEKVEKEAKLEEETERELGVELVQDILEEKFSEEKVNTNNLVQETEEIDQAVEEIEVNQKVVMEEENKLAGFLSEAIVDLEIAENEVEDSMALVEHEEAEAEEKGEESAAAETLAKDYSEVEEREKAVTTTEESTMENVTQESSLENEETHDQEGTTKSEKRKRKSHEQLVERESDEEAKMQEREDQSPALPDSLRLMMSERCEPKLSMEVSKESWVCRTDFIKRSSTEKAQVHSTDGPDESIPVHPVQCNKPFLQQLERSSCSFPAAAAAAGSIGTMREQKLVNAVAYEPFVLTRCKSEPLRTAAKVEPEACFWKSRTIEPHRFGVGAAGVGF